MDFLFGIPELIPFLFVFAIVYGSLELSKVFKNKGVNGVISIVVALFTMINPGVSAFIYGVMPYAIALFVVVFFIGFIRGLFSDKKGDKDYTLPVIIVGLILIFLASQRETISRWMPSLSFLSSDNFVVVMVLFLIAIILYATYKKTG